MTDDRAYLENLLSLLNLRLLTCLGIVDAADRAETHDRILESVKYPLHDLFFSDAEELREFSRLLEALTEKRNTLLERGANLRLAALADLFRLNQDEMLLLTAILAPSLDVRFRRIYELMQGSETPHMDFLLMLVDTENNGRFAYEPLLSMDGKLLSRGLVTTIGGESTTIPSSRFSPAPGLLAWLDGTVTVSPYSGRAAWKAVPEKPGDEPIKTVTSIAEAIEMAEISREPVPMVSFFGPDRELLLNAARDLSFELDRPLLIVDLEKMSREAAEPLLQLAFRDALLNHGIPAITGIDSWIDSGGSMTADIGTVIRDWPVSAVLLTDKNFVFASRDMTGQRLVLRCMIDGLTGAKRYHVWKKCLQNIQVDEALDDDSLRTLAGQFILNSAQIRSAVNEGLGIAVMENRDLCAKDLYEGARVSSMHHLSDLARKMKTRYTLEDLVLPEKQRAEIDGLIAMARNRSKVLEDWGVGKKLVSGGGLSALFTGVPGTGKTLSAQVIAGELGLDLYRVDLSTIVSKYIGETEKNLERIFNEAQSSNVILFFDEADSLFGKRSDVSDAHDRYANIEVSYLLQRIETYDGIVLMATNLGANLDEAFARRINFIIDFPFPDEATRLRLWQLLLPDNIEKEPNINLAPFASAYKIAGGNIRNAIVWAIYDSARNKRPLSWQDLLHGVEREYQKMGKVLPSVR